MGLDAGDDDLVPRLAGQAVGDGRVAQDGELELRMDRSARRGFRELAHRVAEALGILLGDDRGNRQFGGGGHEDARIGHHRVAALHCRGQPYLHVDDEEE